MIRRQPEALLLAWWLKQKAKRFTVDAGVTALLREVAEALESGERIEVRGGPTVLAEGDRQCRDE